MRGRRCSIRQPLAVSPHTVLPAGGVAVLVRADSVPAAEEGQLCAVLRAAGGIRWYSLSPQIAGCARGAAAARVSVATPGKGAGLHAARWILVEGDSVALHSLRELPTPAEARRIVSTFASPTLPSTAAVR